MGKKYGSRQKTKGNAQIANKQLVSNAPSLSEALKAMENKAFQNDGFMENFATTQMLWETQKENEGNKLYDVKKINKCFVDGMKSLRCSKTDCLQFPTKFYKPNQETPSILYCEGHSKTADCSKLNLEMIKNRFNDHFNNIATLDKQCFIVQNQIENMKRESITKKFKIKGKSKDSLDEKLNIMHLILEEITERSLAINEDSKLEDYSFINDHVERFSKNFKIILELIYEILLNPHLNNLINNIAIGCGLTINEDDDDEEGFKYKPNINNDFQVINPTLIGSLGTISIKHEVNKQFTNLANSIK